MRKVFVFLMLVFWSGLLRAELPGVLVWETPQDLETVYSEIYNSLEEKKYFVIFEPNIGKNLAHYADRWGDDYNRNGLQGIRAMVFCSPGYANRISNLDPVMLALCPLHVSLYRQDDKTRIVFLRPVHAGAGSNALALLQELEEEVSAAIRHGIDSAQATATAPPAER